MKLNVQGVSKHYTHIGLFAIIALSVGNPPVVMSAEGNAASFAENGKAQVYAANLKNSKKKKSVVQPAVNNAPLPSTVNKAEAPISMEEKNPGTARIEKSAASGLPDEKSRSHIQNPPSLQNSELRKIILRGEWDRAANYPPFIEFVKACTGKEIDHINKDSRTSLWPELLTYLDRVDIADENYLHIKNEAASDELKSLFPQLDHARAGYNYREAVRLLEDFRKKRKNQRQEMIKIDYLQGQAYELQNKYQEAERYYRKAAGGEEKNVFYMSEHARILYLSGSYKEVEGLYRNALAIREKYLGANHADVATNLNDLAKLLKEQGKYAEAEPLFRRALAIYEKQLSGEHALVATAQNNLAALLDVQGKYAEAEPLYRQSLESREKILGNDHPVIALGLKNLGRLLDAQKKYASSEQLYRRALAIDEKMYGKEHLEVSNDLNNLASSLKLQGKNREAEPLYKRAIEIREKAVNKERESQRYQ